MTRCEELTKSIFDQYCTPDSAGMVSADAARLAIQVALRPDWRLLEPDTGESVAPYCGEPVLIWKPDERMVGEYLMIAYWDDNHFSGVPGFVPVGGHNVQGYLSEVTGTRQGYPLMWAPLPITPRDK